MRKSILIPALFALLALSCDKPVEPVDPEPSVIAVSSVSLSQDSADMLIGETVQLKAAVLPSDATDKEVTWASSKQSVATVSGSGLITAVAEGTSTITASAGGKSATCQVTVSKKVISVTAVTLDRTSVVLEEGQSTTLVATVSPSDATDKTVQWTSSNPAIVSVDGYGTLTAHAEGSAAIIATVGDQSATCAVTVSKRTIPVTAVTLDRNALVMEEGQSTTLVATVTPSDATNNTVQWSSSNPAIVSVDGYGTLTALAEGSAVVIAAAGDKSASCVVTVLKKVIPVISVSLDRKAVTLEPGQSTTLVATVSPADATDKTVSWTNSDDTVISLSGGSITALKEGSSTVTAIAGDKSASCVVTVARSVVPVTSVTLDKTSLTLEKGESVTLVATVSPSDATDKTVSWSSTDASIVSVDQNGTLRAQKGGSATVMAKAGEKSATCRVTVISPVTSVSLDRYSIALEVGQKTVLIATVNPDDATEKTLTWTSSDPSVASVDATGEVVALKKGNATITAAAGGKSASCTVQVSNIPFTISPSSATLAGSGGRFEVKVSCSSSYHVDSKPDWVTEKSVSGQVHTYEVGANPDSEARSGVIVFCDDEGTCLPFNVQQAAGGTFSLDPTTVEMDAKGGTFEVKVTCPIGYHINSMPSWITEVTDPGLIQVHRFKMAENPDDQDRSGVIVFCDDAGTCLSCSVRQKGRVPDTTGGDNENLNEGDPIKW